MGFVNISKAGDVMNFAISKMNLENAAPAFNAIKNNPDNLEKMGSFLSNKIGGLATNGINSQADLEKLNTATAAYGIVETIFTGSQGIQSKDEKNAYIKHAIGGVMADDKGNIAADLDKDGMVTDSEFKSFMANG